MKLLVLDGNSIVNRAFYGIKMLSTKNGTFTNAVYGFLTMLRRLLDEVQPDRVGIAFDLKAPTFRHKMYAGYKADRKGMPPELAGQMQPLKEILSALGYTLVTCEGFEADDILGTLAAACTARGDDCVIATGDRDSLQLVSPTVHVRLASTQKGQPVATLYDEAKIREEYGVSPHQLIDIKAIQGDTSDKIPGVAGIGPKGAGTLIQTFGSLDGVYEHLDDPSIKAGMRAKLIADKENAYLSYTLGTIRTDAPIETDLDAYIVKEPDRQAAASKLAALELFSLIEKFGLNAADAVAAPEESDQPAAVQLDGLSEAQGCEKLEKEPVCVLTLSDEPDCALSICFADGAAQLNATDEVLSALQKNANVRVYDSKTLYRLYGRAGLTPPAVHFDARLAAYLLNPSAPDYGISRLSSEYGAVIPAWENETLAQAAALPVLFDKLQKAIDENSQRELLETIEMPLAGVLADMELTGFAVDRAGIEAYGKQIEVQLKEIEQRIYEEAGETFNINSPKQLGDILFGKLELPHGKKTKNGYSTNAEILESLRYGHPIVGDVLDYRTYAKLKSTYCDGLLKVIEDDGRIHSSFNQTETRTGRISSTEPNLQNIPVRTPLGRELRRFFTARPGWTLVDADYSQIELRVLAHMANDPVMIETFKTGGDIHTTTAARVFGVPVELVTPAMRSSAKAVNFGIVYGIGAFSLAKDLGITRKEADRYIKEYLNNYAGVRDYMENVITRAKEDGYVSTLFGRRRYLPELTSSNFNTRSFGERVARNMPVQGTAADIIKIAMIRVFNRLKAEKLQAKLILQIHDELIVECPLEEAETVKKLLEEEMSGAVSLAVPMVAEAGVGENWYLAKG